MKSTDTLILHEEHTATVRGFLQRICENTELLDPTKFRMYPGRLGGFKREDMEVYVTSEPLRDLFAWHAFRNTSEHAMGSIDHTEIHWHVSAWLVPGHTAYRAFDLRGAWGRTLRGYGEPTSDPHSIANTVRGLGFAWAMVHGLRTAGNVDRQENCADQLRNYLNNFTVPGLPPGRLYLEYFLMAASDMHVLAHGWGFGPLSRSCRHADSILRILERVASSHESMRVVSDFLGRYRDLCMAVSASGNPVAFVCADEGETAGNPSGKVAVILRRSEATWINDFWANERALLDTSNTGETRA